MHSGHKNELLINDWAQFHEVYTQTIWQFKKILAFPIAILFDLIASTLDRFGFWTTSKYRNF